MELAVVSLVTSPPPFGARVVDLTDAGRDDAAPADALAALAAAEVFVPWVLVGRADQPGLVEGVVAGVLDGAEGVFGLAAVVVVGDEVPASIREREVLAVATEHDGLAEAVHRLRADVSERAPRMSEPWARVIASSRTDRAVRAALARRALADDPAYRPRMLSPRQLALLRSVARRVVPQRSPGEIDLAARVDRMLAAGEGDGWRPTGMPADVDAYRAGLDALAAIWMRGPAAQDAVVAAIVDGIAPAVGVFSPHGLSRWFEDVRNDLVRVWLSHPASLARVGYTGFATGGTGPEPAGYLVLGAGEREEWEPDELGRSATNRGARS